MSAHRLGLIFLLFLALVPVASGQEARAQQPGVLQAHRLSPTEGETLKLDGVLSEPFWAAAPAITDFTQQEPSEGTPATVVRTVWKSTDIWVRRTFHLDSTELPNLHLRIHHDEDAEIFINGELVTQLKGYSTDYQLIPMDAGQRSLLRTGQNLLAVHCRQTSGGQFIDVHLVDADKVPQLPKPKRSTKPFVSSGAGSVP